MPYLPKVVVFILESKEWCFCLRQKALWHKIRLQDFITPNTMKKVNFFLILAILLLTTILPANFGFAAASSAGYQSGTEYFKTTNSSAWETVAFDEAFDSGANIAVFAQIQSEFGGADAYIDLRNIDESGFEMRIEEDRGSDASWYDGHHVNEYVSWLAIDMDDMPEGLIGGTENFGNQWGSTQTVTYDEAFDSDPILFAQIQTENDARTARINILDANEIDFEMEIQEDTGNGTSGDWDGWHNAEDVAWIAFESGENPFGGLSSSEKIWQYWKSVTFESEFADTPMVFAMITTENYSDVAIIDTKDVTETGFYAKVDENKLAGWDGKHLGETMMWFAVGEMETPQIIITKNGPAAQEYAVNENDVALINFIIVSDQDITIDNLPISLHASEGDTEAGLLDGTTANFTDVKLTNSDTGDVLAGPVDVDVLTTTLGGSTAIDESSSDDLEAYYIFTDEISVEAGTALNVTLSVDINNNAELDTESIYATLPLGESTSYPEISDSDGNVQTNTDVLIPTSTINGYVMTILAPTLEIGLASTPVAGEVYAAGSTEVPFFGISLSCGDASDCLITDMSLYGYIDEDGTGGFNPAMDNSVTVSSLVDRLYLWDDDDNLVSGSRSVSSTTGELVFTNLNIELDAGDIQIIYVMGDISSSAYVNGDEEDILFMVQSESDVTAEDENGNTITEVSGTPNSDELVYVTTSL